METKWSRNLTHIGPHPGPGHDVHVEFEYSRGGTLAYMAAYDVHRGPGISAIADKTGIVPSMELVGQVMRTEPYATARLVFWVVDNGSSHKMAPSVTRISKAWPTATLVHLPVNASWRSTTPRPSPSLENAFKRRQRLPPPTAHP